MKFDHTKPFTCAGENFYVEAFFLLDSEMVSDFPLRGKIMSNGKFYKNGAWKLKGEFLSAFRWERKTFRLINQKGPIEEKKPSIRCPQKVFSIEKTEKSPLELWAESQFLTLVLETWYTKALRNDPYSIGALMCLYLLELPADVHEDIRTLINLCPKTFGL